MTQDWEEGDGDYLAPELLQEANPTPAADIFSLGATLYECATGEPNTMHLIGLHDLCRIKSSTQSPQPSAAPGRQFCAVPASVRQR